MTVVFANNTSATVSSGGTTAPSSGSTESWTVGGTAGFPTALNSGDFFHVADPTLPNEKVKVTAISGSTWTVTRGDEGTSTVAHVTGFAIQQVVTAGDFGETQQTFNVRSVAWGAKGDGSTDDTTAIQNALTAAATPGGRVFLPAGTYIISQTLQISSNTSLLGEGMGFTTIKAAASFAATQVGSNPGMVMICTASNSSASKIAIEDLTLDYNAANISSVPGYANQAETSQLGIQNVTGLRVERVEFINPIGYSVFPYTCTDVVIRECRILTGQASHHSYVNQDGIHTTDCNDVRILANYIDSGTSANGGDDAIAIQGVSAGSSRVTITGNSIARSGAHGISLVLGGAAVSNVAISGNSVNSTNNDAVIFFYTTYVNSATYLITDVAITGNVFQNVATGGSGSGLTLQDAYAGTGAHAGTAGYAGVSILGNVFDTFTNSGGVGIYAAAGSDLTISDNTFRNWGAVRGIEIGDNNASTSQKVTNAVVSGNTVDMSTTSATSPFGIVVVDSPDVVITDNAIIGASGPISGSIGIGLLAIGTAITGAVVNDNRIKTWAQAISEQNDGAAPDYNTYVGNNCHGNTAFISIVGSHDIPASANLATVNVVA